MKRHTHTLRPHPSRGPQGLLLAACALLVVLGGAAPAAAQLPTPDPPGYPGSQIYASTFNNGSAYSAPSFWEPATWDSGGSWGIWELRPDSELAEMDGPCPGWSGRWTGDGSFYLRENGSDNMSAGGTNGQSAIFPWATLLGLPFPTNPASDFKNVRIEFDFYLRDDPEGQAGVVIRGADDNQAQPARTLDSGYRFRIYDIPDDGDDVNKASYELVKRVSMTDYVVASGEIDTSADPGWPAWTKDSVNEDFCYRLRVDYYCGYIRAQVKQFACTGASCTETTWHTVMEWTDDFTTWGPELAVGTGRNGWIGIYSGNGSGSAGERNFFDNFDIWSWGETCVALPTATPTPPPGATDTPTPVTTPPTATPTSPPLATATPTPTPNDGWTPWGEANRENIATKLLYEGSLLDYSAVPSATEPRIDVATLPPDPADRYSFCDGWKLLVDLPDPIMSSELDKVRSYLERSATSINYVTDGAGSFVEWGKNFEDDELQPTYDPVPLVAHGATPINNSLLDAFDWYVAQREAGGRWENDPLKECRKWYVVLITDGGESCDAYTRPDGSGGGFACDPGNAAEKFADPGAYGAVGVEEIPIFTIGFAGSAATAPPQLVCISDITNGEYFGATNAAELKDALYEVLNQLNTEDARSFSPFKVSPPPSSKGGPATEQDFLVIYPLFQPIDESSLWRGDLYGFRLDRSQPTLPADANCEVDRTQMVTNAVTGNDWDARARLEDQLAQATPVRPVLMGRYDLGTSTWVRHDLSEIPSNATLRLYLQNRMNEVGGVTDLETQEVVNFVRALWMDDDGVDPPPIDWDTGTAAKDPRPAGAPVLGDFYHSQPTIISPPNRSMFFFDYGFGSAHDYPSFMTKHEKRRRVVLVGANDALLHAFDGGIWDRDRVDDTETYHLQHDLGDGSELFTYLPHAVMPHIYEMTYGDYQQYLVDGPISVSDVFIDHDGDTVLEWRTVALVNMRRGGRGISALDITQPDPLDVDDVPTVPADQFPGCLDGTASGCDGEYPKVLWEFEDTSDADGNCGGAPNCQPYWDLGWTWSKPAIARLAINNDPNPPDDVFVAFFGGGWSRDQVMSDAGTPADSSDDYLVDTTGRHLYAVDIATGAILKKWFIGEYGIPGAPTALDSDIDGFHDRIYFGDSNGSLWRLEYPGPTDLGATGVDLGAGHLPQRLFDFRTDFPDRQQFFTRPVTVPALFDGSGYTWALAMGSGDRANLEFEDTVNNPIDHFFFVLDVGDSTTRGESDLVAVNYDELDGDFDCENSALDPANNRYGWYLSLRPNEKVVFDATVINGHVLFPTFDPSRDVVATHNVPDECVPAGGGGTPSPTATPLPGLGDPLCDAAGLGRAYDLWFECGLGDYSENNDIYTGLEDYTIGGTTYVTYTESYPTEGETEEFPNVTGHVVTNWRQD